jgi:hypothetical protein
MGEIAIGSDVLSAKKENYKILEDGCSGIPRGIRTRSVFSKINLLLAQAAYTTIQC